MHRVLEQIPHQNGTLRRTKEYKEFVIDKPSGVQMDMPESFPLKCALTKPVTIKMPLNGLATAIHRHGPLTNVSIYSSRVPFISEGAYENTTARYDFGQDREDNKKMFAMVYSDSTPWLKGPEALQWTGKPPYFFRLEQPRDRQDAYSRDNAKNVNEGINADDIVAQNAANALRHAQNLKAAGVECNREDATLTPGNMIDLALMNLGKPLTPSQTAKPERQEERSNRRREVR